MATAVIPHDILVPAGTKSVGEGRECNMPPGDILPEQPQQQNSRFFQVVLRESAPYTALPGRVLFGALRHPSLKLLEPIPLRTERSDSGISVIWEDGQEFGFGETLSDAITDFGDTIAELYLHLGENEALSSDLIVVRDQLSHYIDIRQQ